MITITAKIDKKLAHNAVRDAAMNGINDNAQVILAQAKQEVPFDESPLRDSGQINRYNEHLYISFGRGHSRPYAVIQHENLLYNHPTPGTKAKYLSDPFKQHALHTTSYVAARLRKEL